MRFLFLLLSVSILMSISCRKSNESDKSINIPSGVYKGTFKRSFSSDISNVTITFSPHTFEGQSEVTHYPDICNGSYLAGKDSISFRNGCAYTANFDWSYILEGKFKIILSGDSLVLTRGYEGVAYFYDTYKLKRQ
jgi:hypothetical protein